MLARIFIALALLAAVSSDCPAGFTSWSPLDTCVQFSTKNMSWLDAQEQCQSFGGNLLYIRSLFENMVATNQAPNTEFWIGLSLLRSSKWSWVGVDVDSNAIFTNWDTTQQDDASMQCAFVTNTGQGTWMKDICNKQRPFMCNVDPATFNDATATTSTKSPVVTTSSKVVTNSRATSPSPTTHAPTSPSPITHDVTSFSPTTQSPPQSTTKKGVSGFLTLSLVTVVAVLNS